MKIVAQQQIFKLSFHASCRCGWLLLIRLPVLGHIHCGINQSKMWLVYKKSMILLTQLLDWRSQFGLDDFLLGSAQPTLPTLCRDLPGDAWFGTPRCSVRHAVPHRCCSADRTCPQISTGTNLDDSTERRWTASLLQEIAKKSKFN